MSRKELELQRKTNFIFEKMRSINQDPNSTTCLLRRHNKRCFCSEEASWKRDLFFMDQSNTKKTGHSKAGGTNVEKELECTETEGKSSLPSIITPVHAAPKDTRDPALNRDADFILQKPGFYVRFSKRLTPQGADTPPAPVFGVRRGAGL